MANYKVIKEGKDFHIKEIETDQVVKILDSKDEAYTLVKKLNLGGGFDGFTPRFFLFEG